MDTPMYAGTGNFNSFFTPETDRRTDPKSYGYWLSLRPCPKCGKNMHANGNRFKCFDCDIEIPYKSPRKA